MNKSFLDWKPVPENEHLTISKDELPEGWYKSTDPRPDLAYDSKDWVRLLKLAKKMDPELAGILHGFRCGGLRLHRGGRGWALRPDFDPKTSIWESRTDYETDRDKWLIPYQDKIIELLRRL